MADPRLQFILDLDFNAFKQKAKEAFNDFASGAQKSSERARDEFGRFAKSTDSAFKGFADEAKKGTDKASEEFAKFGAKVPSSLNGLLGALGGLGSKIGGALKLDKLTGLVPGLSTAFGGLSGVLASTNPILAGVTLGVNVLSDAFNGLLSIGQEFHKAFSIIRTTTGQTGAALQALKGDLKEAFTSTASSDLPKMAKNLADLNAQTGLTGKPLQQLTQQFAILEGFGDAPSIRSFTRHLGDFGVPADKATESLDGIYVASQRTGVPMGRLSDLLTKFGAPLRNFGFSVAEGTALLGRFEKEGVNTELVMGSLRIASGKFAASGIDLRIGLNDAIKSIKEAGSSSEATALAMKTFGRRAGADMADTIRGGKFEIDAFVKSLKGSKETIIGAKSDVASLGGVFEKINRQAKVALEPLGTFLVEGLTAAARAVSSVVTPIIQGIGAVISGFIVPAIEAVIGAVQRIGTAIGSVFSAFGDLNSQADQLAKAWDAVVALVSGSVDVMLVLGELLIESVVTPVELIADFIGQWISAIQEFTGEAESAKGPFEGIDGAIRAIKLALTTAVASVRAIISAFKEVKEAISEGFGKILKGDVLGGLKGIFDGITGAASNVGKDVSDAVNQQLLQVNIDVGKKALEDKLTLNKTLDISKDVDELRAQLAAATSEAEKNSISEKIAAAVPAAIQKVELVTDEFGNVTRKITLANEELDKFRDKSAKAAEGGGGENAVAQQKQILDGLQNQFVAQDRAVAKQQELNAALAEQKLRHGENSEEAAKAQEAIDAQKKVVESGAADLQKTLSSIDASGALKNLTPEAQLQFDNIKNFYRQTFADNEAKEIADAFAKTLTDAASLQGDLDKNNAIPDLIEKFRNAKTEVEKNSIAATIEETAGIGTVAYDNLGNAVELNIAKIDDFRDANGKAISDKSIDLLAQYKKGLQDQAGQLATNREALQVMADRIRATNDKDALKLLKAEYDKLKGKVNESNSALQKSVVEGKKFGLIKGDIKQVGTEFGFAAREATVTAQSVSKITTQAEDTTAAVAAIAEEFKQLSNDAKAAVDADVSTLALEVARKKLGQSLSAEEAKSVADARARIEGDLQLLRVFEEARAAVEAQYNIKSVKAKTKTAKDKKDIQFKEDDADLKRAQFLSDQKLAAIQDETLQRAEAARQIVVLELASQKSREKNLKEEIRVARVNGDTKLAQEKQRELDRLRTATDTADTFKNLLKKAEQARNDELIKIQRELAAKLFAIDIESANRRIELNRATAEAITSDDVESTLIRAELLRAAHELEAKAKIDGLLFGSEQFKTALTAVTQAEAATLQTAQLSYLESVQSLQDRRAELVATNATPEEISTATRDLETAVNDRAKIVADAQTKLREQGAKFQETFRLALAFPEGVVDPDTLTPQLRGLFDTLTDEQRRWLQTMTTMTAEQRQILLDSLAKLTTESTRLGIKLAEESERAISEARNKARIATITDIDEREKEERLLAIQQSLSAQLKAIAAANVEIERQAALAATRRIKIEEDGALSPEARLAQLNDVLRIEEEVNVRRADLVLKRVSSEAKAEQDSVAVQLLFQRRKNLLLEAGLSTQESLLFAFGVAITEEDKKQAADREEARRKETADLAEQLRQRRISEEEYYKKLGDIRKAAAGESVRIEEIADFTLRKLRLAGTVFSQRITNTANQQIAKAEEDLSIALTARQLNDAAQKKAIAEGNLAEQERLAKEGLAIDDANTAARTKLYTATALKITGTITDLMLQGVKDFGEISKAILGIAFDFLQAMVPIWTAQIVGGSLATPQSILSGGTAGIIQFTALTAILESAVQVARAVVNGFAEGIVDVRGPGTTTSDSISARISRGESVITARGTTRGKNAEALRWLNSTGGDLRDWQSGIMQPLIIIPQGGDGNDHVVRQLEYLTSDLSERMAGVESAVLGTKSAVETQRLTARTTIDPTGLKVIVDRAAKKRAR